MECRATDITAETSDNIGSSEGAHYWAVLVGPTRMSHYDDDDDEDGKDSASSCPGMGGPTYPTDLPQTFISIFDGLPDCRGHTAGLAAGRE